MTELNNNAVKQKEVEASESVSKDIDPQSPSIKNGKSKLVEDDYTGRQNKGFFSALNRQESE